MNLHLDRAMMCLAEAHEAVMMAKAEGVNLHPSFLQEWIWGIHYCQDKLAAEGFYQSYPKSWHNRP